MERAVLIVLNEVNTLFVLKQAATSVSGVLVLGDPA